MQALTSTSTVSSKTSFLEGGGELGEMIRSHDWSQTALGSPESWPQSLKTCIRIMLTSRQPMWIGWGKKLIKFYNDPYKTIVGGKHPWALGQPASVVWDEIWHHIEPMLKTVMEKDEGTYVESQLLIMERNGYAEETYYTFSYTPIPDDNGEAGGMICANTDDTQRIIGERQLRTLKDLGKSFAEMQTITEVYQNALKVLETNSKDFPFAILYKVDNEKSRAWPIAYAGISEKQTSFPSQIDLLKPKEGALNFCRAFNKREIVISENNGRRKNIPKGAWEIEPSHFIHIPIIPAGSNHPDAILSAALNPYRIFDETYKQFITLIADQIALEVNNVTAYEQERKRAEALAEIDKAKTVFFSNISHEFRTPLTLMLGPLEELLNNSQNKLSSQEKNKIETTHRNAIRLLRLVNNLLDFSRMETGRTKARFQLTDIAEYTKQLAGNFQSAIETANLKFNVVCEAATHFAYLDKSMWEKIVFNLLSNAFKYTLNGSITVSVSLKDDHFELKVSDTGVGIPEKELPKMFQRFHRVENAQGRSFEGSGIGLSLVSELVKIHGGTVSVKSKVDVGSEFTVLIPAGKEHLSADHIIESADHELSVSEAFLEQLEILTEQTVSEEINPENDLFTILIADDNADMRTYMKSLLQKDYRVITANNGIEALEKLDKFSPDLVVSDIMMPVMDGIELMKKVKANAKTNRIPVILVSARAGEESKIEGYETGADDYLTKPFSTKELLARIKAQINISQKRSESESHLKEFLLQAPAAIAIFEGKQHIFTLANEPYQKLSGRTKEQLLGRSVKEVFEGTEGHTLHQLLDEVYATGHPYVANAVAVTFDLNDENKTAYYDTILHPIRNNKGEITRVMAFNVDVTEQVSSLKKIEENEKRKDDFIKMANHELKTPVTSIKGYVQLLLESSKNQDNPLPPLMIRSSLVSIDKQITRLTRLMSELLDLSKIESGQLELNKESFNLNELVIETVQDILYTNSKHNIHIYHDFNCLVHGDKDRIGQVLINFLVNAIKYSPDSDKIEIDIKKADKNSVSVSVKDYGIGIEKKYHEKIFERFYRAEGNKEQTFPGFGIGLFIAKEMIQRHDGMIYLESEKGKGSTFTFVLPITQEQKN